jgi:serine/threonine protein kinase
VSIKQTTIKLRIRRWRQRNGRIDPIQTFKQIQFKQLTVHLAFATIREKLCTIYDRISAPHIECFRAQLDRRKRARLRKLGKYEVLGELGLGAMGVVYRARAPIINRMVALKTIITGLADDPNLLERFY